LQPTVGSRSNQWVGNELAFNSSRDALPARSENNPCKIMAPFATRFADDKPSWVDDIVFRRFQRVQGFGESVTSFSFGSS
jgi:hypothetical protein